MILNNKGYLFITKHEGLSLKPYLCPAKIPTIGYGNTYYSDGKKVTLLDKEITKQQAFEMFKEIANRFGKRVNELATTELTQNQFNALVSFAYNVGTGNFASSTLLKKVNKNPNDLTIKAEFLRWNKAGGKVINGLTNRRTEEADLYFLP
jgi:lysozyme